MQLTIRDPSSTKCHREVSEYSEPLRHIKLQPSTEKPKNDSRRRSRNGRIKVGRVRQNGSRGKATGIVNIGEEKVWTMHAMGGMVINEEDAGDFVGRLTLTQPARPVFFLYNLHPHTDDE